MTTRTHVTTPDGELPAYLWLPNAGTGPGILLLQEIFGVSRYIQRRAQALADAGYVVLAPELYWRLDQQSVDEAAPDAVQQAMGLAGRLDWDTTVGDSLAALEHLAALEQVSGTPGVLGFCFGGGLAFSVASLAEPAVAVCYYGSSLPDQLALAPEVRCPSLHHVGTADSYLAVDDVRAAAAASGTPGRVETYDGADHAFDNDDFFNHHPEASQRAWSTTLSFLGEHLPG